MAQAERGASFIKPMLARKTSSLYTTRWKGPWRGVRWCWILDTGLVTLCAARIGNGYEAREVGHTFYFGRIAGVGDGKAPLHGFTHDLVGKAIRWNVSGNGDDGQTR